MTSGGPRPKRRPDDRRGGARCGAGALVRRLQLDKDTAQELRILTIVRRGITENPALSPLDVATTLIHQAYLEYEEGIEDHGVDTD